MNTNIVGVAQELFNSLDNNTTLKFLDVSGCDLRFKGCVQMSHCLKKNKVLETLNMSNNGVMDKGSMLLKGALEANKTLKHLSLAYNKIGFTGSEALAQVLTRVNRTLESLNLGYNMIDDKGLELFKQLVLRNDVLSGLNLHMQGFEWKVVTENGINPKHVPRIPASPRPSKQRDGFNSDTPRRKNLQDCKISIF